MKDELIIGIGAASVIGLFVLSAYISNFYNQTSPVEPVGENMEDDENLTDNEGDDVEQPQRTEETEISVTDKVEVREVDNTLDDDTTTPASNPPVRPETFVPGKPIERGRGGGGGDNDRGGNGDKFAQGVEVRLHVIPNQVPSPGRDVSMYGIARPSSAVSSTTFELYGADCPLQSGIPCAVETDLSEMSPPTLILTVEELEFCDNNCEEYAVKFEGEHFTTAGEYQIRAKFYDPDGDLIALEEAAVLVSFMVIPESPLGILVLMGSSLAAFGGFIVVRRKRKNSHKKSREDLGI
jgi:hypothetical protein